MVNEEKREGEGLEIHEITEKEKCPSEQYTTVPDEFKGLTRKEIIAKLIEQGYSKECIISCIKTWFPNVKNPEAYFRAVKSQIEKERVAKEATKEADILKYEEEEKEGEEEEREEESEVELGEKVRIESEVIKSMYETTMETVLSLRGFDDIPPRIKRKISATASLISSLVGGIEVDESTNKLILGALVALSIGTDILVILKTKTEKKHEEGEEERKEERHESSALDRIRKRVNKAWR